jgi:hypothetical protein
MLKINPNAKAQISNAKKNLPTLIQTKPTPVEMHNEKKVNIKSFWNTF